MPRVEDRVFLCKFADHRHIVFIETFHDDLVLVIGRHAVLEHIEVVDVIGHKAVHRRPARKLSIVWQIIWLAIERFVAVVRRVDDAIKLCVDVIILFAGIGTWVGHHMASADRNGLLAFGFSAYGGMGLDNCFPATPLTFCVFPFFAPSQPSMLSNERFSSMRTTM